MKKAQKTNDKKRVNSRAKGAAGERELAHALNAALGIAARRGQQFSGIEGEDVVGLPGVHIECKREERLNIFKAMTQANRDAKSSGKTPAIFHRKNKQPWLVTVALENLVTFSGIIHGVASGGIQVPSPGVRVEAVAAKSQKQKFAVIAAPPKPRGRPRKTNPPVATVAKRGRPPAKATVVETPPAKKRGRPSKPAVTAFTSADEFESF